MAEEKLADRKIFGCQSDRFQDGKGGRNRASVFFYPPLLLALKMRQHSRHVFNVSASRVSLTHLVPGKFFFAKLFSEAFEGLLNQSVL